MAKQQFQKMWLPLPIQALYNKMINGYSPKVCIVGDETGIGKSRIALRIAELLHWNLYGKNFDVKENVFFSMTKFKDSLFNKEGKILIVEEAEIELGSDDWQSISNRWFSRISDTQRIKGNLYIIVLPLFMALARKHRRRINWIIDVKGRGFANYYKILKNPAQLLGDDMSKFPVGSVILGLPKCDKEFDIIDKLNKQRIEQEQGDMFDKEIEYRKLVQSKKVKKMKEFLKGEKKTDLYTYRCHACQYIFNSKIAINKVMKCANCEKNVFIDNQNLVQLPEIDISETTELNKYKDEN